MDNMYELDLDIRGKGNDVCGLNLCMGDGRKVAVSYDVASGYLTIDRTNSTDASIPKFERMCTAEIPANDGKLNLRIFVDKSTVEIFAQDGRRVFTLLTFAAPDQTGIELFSQRGTTDVRLTAWPLKSIWK